MSTTRPLTPELIDHRSEGQRKTRDAEPLEVLARLMDSAFEIPVLRLRFGLDAILGLLPGFGDAGTSIVSLLILLDAHRRGVPRVTLTRMGMNLLVDWLIGSIPLAGDIFDVYWKANQKNMELLRRYEAQKENAPRRRIGDWMFLVSIVAILLAVLAGSVALTFFMGSALLHWIQGN